MSRLRSHHHPKVSRFIYSPRWIGSCACGWTSIVDNWHLAFVAALDHAESSLR
jgi:hypothetical protein